MVYASTLGSPSYTEVPQLLLGRPPRSRKVFPPSAENPKPVSSSLLAGAPHADRKPVASFQASTTYGPAAAMDVSDCPWAETPAGEMSSCGVAASTLVPKEEPLEGAAAAAAAGDCGGVPENLAARDAAMAFPHLPHKG